MDIIVLFVGKDFVDGINVVFSVITVRNFPTTMLDDGNDNAVLGINVRVLQVRAERQTIYVLIVHGEGF